MATRRPAKAVLLSAGALGLLTISFTLTYLLAGPLHPSKTSGAAADRPGASASISSPPTSAPAPTLATAPAAAGARRDTTSQSHSVPIKAEPVSANKANKATKVVAKATGAAPAPASTPSPSGSSSTSSGNSQGGYGAWGWSGGGNWGGGGGRRGGGGRPGGR